jgi:hypothetical protein
MAAAMLFQHLAVGRDRDGKVSPVWTVRSVPVLSRECGVEGFDQFIDVLGLGDER